LIVTTLPLALPLLGCPGDDTSTTDDGPNATTTGLATGTTAPTPATSSTGEAESSGDGSSSNGSSGGTTAADSTTTGAADTATTTGGIAVCGNNSIEGAEVCDLAQLNGETCQSLGFQGGQLGCLLTCEDYNLLGCFICGNEVVDIAEDCEETVHEDITCESLGFEAGDVTCGADCLYDTTECSICGDGVQQGPEQCDGVDLDGETCMSLGFDMGNLGCVLGTCTYAVGGCSGGQYVQDFEAGVLPPEFTPGGNADWVVDGTSPIAGAFSAHSGAIIDSQNSTMEISANYAIAGELRFFHEESTEGSFDFLRFFVDGVEVMSWSGVNAAVEFVEPVAAGAHTFEWQYTKDGSISSGADTVWIDDLQMVNGVPM